MRRKKLFRMKCSEKIAKKWPSFHCVGGLPGVNELPNFGRGLIIKQLFSGFALDITRDDRFYLWYREDYGSKLAETMVSCGKHWPGIAGQVRLLTLQPSLWQIQKTVLSVKQCEWIDPAQGHCSFFVRSPTCQASVSLFFRVELRS